MKARVALVLLAFLSAGCSNPCSFGPVAQPPVTAPPGAAGKSWAPAVKVATVDAGADGLKLLVGPNDMMVAVWHQAVAVNNSLQDQLVMVSGDTSGNWGQPLVVLAGSNGRSSLDATIDRMGNVLLAWIENGATPVVNAVRVSAFTGSALPVHQVGTAASVSGTGNLRLAMTPAGDAVAIWVGTPANLPAILVSRYAGATDTWDATSTRLNPATSPAGAPAVAIDGNGNALTSWIQASTTGVAAVHQDCFNAASGKWGGFFVQSPTNFGLAAGPNAAFDSAGNALAIWSQAFSNALGIMTRRYNRAQGQWEQGFRQDQPSITGAGGNFLPQLAVSPNNNQGFAAWFYTPLLQRGAVYGLPYSGSFQNMQRIDTTVDPANPSSGQVQNGGVKIAMAPDGEALAMWTQTDGLTARFRSFTGAWFSPVDKLSATTSATAIDIAMDSVSRGTAMWIDGTALMTRRFQ
jgi:hypothetical protein